MPLEMTKFQTAASSTVGAISSGGNTELILTSTPPGAEINIDGSFVGNTPSTISVPAAEHSVSIKMAGFQTWEKSIRTSGGKVSLSAPLVKAEDAQSLGAAK